MELEEGTRNFIESASIRYRNPRRIVGLYSDSHTHAPFGMITLLPEEEALLDV
jgi:hypothetical protein